MSRLSGYADCLSSTSRYKFFVDWFERLSREVQQEQVTGKPSPHRPGAALDAVRIAVDRLLEPCGWSSIEWDFAADEIVANHQAHGRLPVSILSDGIRNIVGLVADLALRTSRLNPHFGRESARLTSGIVLIDEVDMHLHPVWQQLVLPAFRGAFPAVQFIVTTHSPQVLSTTKAESIRIIRSDGHKGVAFKPLEQTEGVESSYLMALVLGADPVPPIEIVRLLSEYRSIIQQGLSDSIGAQVLKEKLEAHFGSSHPIILDSQRLIRLEKFKRENLPLPSQQPHADK